MKNGLRLYILLVICLVLTSLTVSAFDFVGYTYDVNKTALPGTNVSCNIYYGPNIETILAQPSTLSTANGSFRLTLNDTWTAPGLPWLSYSIKPVIIHNNSAGLADFMGASAPDFPGAEFASLGSVDFYLKSAITLNITANNGSVGTPVNFSYMIKDKTLGYPLYNHFTQGDPDIDHIFLTVPKDRSYSIMIFPYHSFPLSYDVSNISSYGEALTINVSFSTAQLWKTVTGYINSTGDANTGAFTDFGAASNITIIPYLMEPGSMVGKDHPLPLNMTNMRNDIQTQTGDYINITSGFYNITMPGPAMGMDVILFVNVQNGSGDYFGALRNLTLSYSSNSISGLNISVLPLVGVVNNFTVQSAVAQGPWNNRMIWTKQGNFSINNGSSGTDSVPNNAHVEVIVDYSSIGQGNFTWMLEVMQSDFGNFKIPIFNAAIKRINVYAPDFAPQKMGKSAAQLAPASGIINVTMKNFNPGGIEGADMSDLYMDMFISNSSCDRYNARGIDCSVFAGAAEKGKDQFSPLTAVMGGGKISFRMRQNSTGITVHYVDVDLLASGPPDAMFDSNSNNSASGSALDQAWRFGSNGPEIYDTVIMGIPYNESDVSEAHAQRVVIKKLYDENWALIWNATDYPNGLDTSNVSFSSYADFNQLWFNTTAGGMACQDISAFNLTQGCYSDKASNMNWLVIPHFSGLGPQITSVATLGNISTDDVVYQCYPTCSVLVNLNVTNTNLVNKNWTFSINNTDTYGGINFTVSVFNSTISQWNVGVGINESGILNFSLQANNMFRINITMNKLASTTWTFAVLINDTYYNMTRLIDAISLDAPANGTKTGRYGIFNSTLYSSNWTSQACGLYINNSLASYNGTVLNGTRTVFSFTMSEGNQPWYISCNVTGNSTTRYITVDTTAPAIVSISRNLSAGHTGNSILISSNWTESSVTEQNLTCTLFANNVQNVSYASNGTWCNFTYISTPADYPNVTFYINATDKYGNTGLSTSVVTQLNLTRSFIGNISTMIDFSAASSSNVTLYISSNMTSSTIEVIGVVPSTAPTNLPKVLKGIDIVADNDTKANLTWAYIQIFYTDSQISAADIDESSLKMYYYNVTSSAWQVEATQGVNTSGNLVWANVTHFSIFGLFGTAPVSTTTTSDGGSSTPGGTQTPVNVFKLLKAVAGQESILTINDEDSGINRIEFVTKEDARAIEFTIDKLDSLPSDVDELDATEYKIFEITTKNLPDSNIKSAKIKFQVSKDWLDEKGFEASHIALNRYIGSWKELPTKKTGENSDMVFFEASSEGFSVFAVVAKKPSVEAEAEEEAVPGEQVVHPTMGPAQGETKLTKWLLITVIVLAFLVLLAIIATRNREKLMFWKEPSENERQAAIKDRVMNRMRRQSRGD